MPDIKGVLAVIALCFCGAYGIIHGSVPDWLIGITVGLCGTFYVVQQKQDTVKALVARNISLLQKRGSLDDVVNKWLPFPRCWSHIALGVIVGAAWAIPLFFGLKYWPVSIVLAILSKMGADLFIAYEKQQDKNCETQSYLDIREFTTTAVLSLIIAGGVLWAVVF